MTGSQIDIAARAYIEAATALANALLTKLEAEAPDIAAKAQQALEHGEQMQLVLAFSPQAPEIRWQIVDDYECAKRLVTIPARMPSAH